MEETKDAILKDAILSKIDECICAIHRSSEQHCRRSEKIHSSNSSWSTLPGSLKEQQFLTAKLLATRQTLENSFVFDSQ